MGNNPESYECEDTEDVNFGKVGAILHKVCCKLRMDYPDTDFAIVATGQEDKEGYSQIRYWGNIAEGSKVPIVKCLADLILDKVMIQCEICQNSWEAILEDSEKVDEYECPNCGCMSGVVEDQEVE